MKKRAFTLIELIVVITIIAILVAAVSISFNKAQQKGRDARRKSDLKTVQQALEVYYDFAGNFPSENASAAFNCDTPYSVLAVNWGFTFQCGSDTFIQQLPKEPIDQTTDGYFYRVENTSRQKYFLWAKLENDNDPDITIDDCGDSAGKPTTDYNYCVVNQ